MHWLKRTAKVLLALLGAVVAVLLVVAGINQFDEDLNPAVKPMLDLPAARLAPEQNGYFLILGFNAAADKDPHAVGMEIDKRVRAHYSNSGSFLTGPRIDASVAGQAPPLPKDIRSFCDPGRQACLDAYREASKLADLEKQVALYLKRYARLIAYPGYEDRPLFTFNDLFPVYGEVTFASRLAVAGAARMIAAGQHREGAERIASDLRFWRRAQAGSNHLLGKMLAANRISADLKLLNELIARYPVFAAQQATQLVEMTRPFSPSEIEYRTVLRHEQAAAMRQLHALGQAPWNTREEMRDFAKFIGSLKVDNLATVAPAGYLPNATLNLLFELNTTQAPVWSAAPGVLPQVEQEVRTRLMAVMQQRTGGLAMLYNPTGKAILNATYPEFENYHFRLHDLDGYLRATALHARIRATGSKGSAIPTLIAQAGAAYYDPYTGKPMVWNAEKHSLSVMQHDTTNNKKAGMTVIVVGK
jgi:hypothetical protein